MDPSVLITTAEQVPVFTVLSLVKEPQFPYL